MSLWSRVKRLLSSSPPSHDIDMDRLAAVLNYAFNDESLARIGLTHRSFVRAHNGAIPSNERLEFLGDSVLGLVIAEQLFHDNPHLPEGDLTKRKAMLVNETALTGVAIDIGLNQVILMSDEEVSNGGRERPSIIADTFEAVIAAIFLDGGLDAARRFIASTLYARREEIMNDASQHNYKGELLEKVQGAGDGLPQYNVILESGPDHDKTFHVVVTISDIRCGDGTGSSKKEAEQKAARMALEYLSRHPLSE